jgi:hypothetical protein
MQNHKITPTHAHTFTQELVDNRAGCFEWFGLDFMVDRDLHVWNLECNISPDLSRGTEVAHPFSVYERELGNTSQAASSDAAHPPAPLWPPLPVGARLVTGMLARPGPDLTHALLLHAVAWLGAAARMSPAREPSRWACL